MEIKPELKNNQKKKKKKGTKIKPELRIFTPAETAMQRASDTVKLEISIGLVNFVWH